MTSWTEWRAQLVELHRRPEDDPELLEARARLKAEMAEPHVRDAVAAYPPLTEYQLNFISSVLHRSRPQ